MARAISNISYIISGICFALIIAIGAGYIKFLDIQPSKVSVDIIQYDSKDYAKLVLKEHQLCNILVDYPYSKMNYFVSNNKIVLPIESTHTTFIPLSVKYDCKFLVFHKMGNQVVYAQIN